MKNILIVLSVILVIFISACGAEEKEVIIKTGNESAVNQVPAVQNDSVIAEKEVKADSGEMPDLVVKSISFPDAKSFAAGSEIVALITVENIGNKASGMFNAELTFGGIKKTFSFSSLNAGGTASKSDIFTLKEDLSQAEAVVDAENKIVESDEENNKLVQKIEAVKKVEITTNAKAAEGRSLADFPAPFFEGGEFDTFIVVGDKAPSSDVLAASSILPAIQAYILSKNVELDISENSKLTSEVVSITGKNFISVGNACNNELTASVLKSPSDCKKGLKDGEARIELYEDSGNYILLVYGSANEDTRKAAKLLAKFETNKLNGTKVCVGGSLNSPEAVGC